MNTEEYEIAVRELSALFDAPPEPNTPEGTRFEVLISLVYQYEQTHLPLD
jgi:HTH-type transcriptional regulator/antitoxin HigA